MLHPSREFLLAAIVVLVVLVAAYFVLRKTPQKCESSTQCGLNQKCAGGTCVPCGCAQDQQCVAGVCTTCSCPVGQKCFFGKCVQATIDFQAIQQNFKPFNYQVNSIGINAGVVQQTTEKYTSHLNKTWKEFNGYQSALVKITNISAQIVAGLSVSTPVSTYGPLKNDFVNASTTLGAIGAALTDVAKEIPKLKHVTAADSALIAEYIQKTQAAYQGATAKIAILIGLI